MEMNKMRELKKEFNIHITVEPMIKQYHKVLLIKHKSYGIKPCGVSFKQYAKNLMHDHSSRETCGGFILDNTGDMKLNKWAITERNYKIYNHKSPIGSVIAIISHEFMHYLLSDDTQTNHCWDNIAHDLEQDGYLGSA
jgi:hypothetical protein